jgi:glycine/D-amino acid oxidase-like deaminating enzyme
LARAAQAAGAVIHEGAAVTRIAQAGADWVVETGAHRVTARRLMIATNAYHRPLQGATIPSVLRVPFFQLATRPGAALGILEGGEGSWSTGLIMTSFRTDAAGRLIVGAMGLPEMGGRAIHHGWAARIMARAFPQLKGEVWEHGWSGQISMTSDHVPKILRLGDGALAVFGYSGRGISPGTVFGAAIATALLTDDESGLPIPPIDGYAEQMALARTVYFEAGARLLHFIDARV